MREVARARERLYSLGRVGPDRGVILGTALNQHTEVSGVMAFRQCIRPNGVSAIVLLSSEGTLMSEPKSRFDGDLENARFRLRSFVEWACQVLDAQALNLASFHLAVYMDSQSLEPMFRDRFTAQMEQELASLTGPAQ